MRKGIVMLFLVFALIGIGSAYQYIHGINQDTFIIDSEVPTPVANYISNLPTVNNVLVSGGETLVDLDNSILVYNERQNTIQILKRIENIMLNVQSNLLFSTIGELNCRTASNGLNYTSTLVPSVTPGRANEVWTINPACNNLGSSVISP